MSTGALSNPVIHLMAQLDELRFGDVPDMGEVGRLLMELAADEESFAPLIAQMPAESPGVHWLAPCPNEARAWCWSTGRKG
jgi:hypothetical protein